MMCKVAEELFEEYYAAVETPLPPDHPNPERRVWSAKRMLMRHNVHHHCCVTLHFEISPASGRRWNFRLQ